MNLLLLPLSPFGDLPIRSIWKTLTDMRLGSALEPLSLLVKTFNRAELTIMAHGTTSHRISSMNTETLRIK